jgi:hypothetical protein
MGVLLSLDLPTGWIKRGSQPDSYEMGIAKGEGYKSKNAATIKSIDTAINGFGTLMQTCLAGNYVGKRIRMSGYVKTKDADTARLWLRIDAIDSTSQKDSVTSITLGLSNMHPITGTTDWKKYDIVMDVPSHASRLAFGGSLSHTGQMWFDNLAFKIVDNTVRTTSTIPDEWQKSKMTRKQFEENTRSRPPQLLPTNLDFEK